MLLDKEIETGLNGGMAKYYESLGYDIPRRMTKQYKMQVPLHAKIKVKISDLPKNSMLKVRVECDCCKKEMKMAYQSYCCYKHEDDTYYCNKCKAKLFNSGKNSSNWNPNITDEERELKRNTLEYTKWVKTVLARDNYICQCCGKEIKKEITHYHISWLESAVGNFKKQNMKVHMVKSDMTIGEFIKMWAKEELSRCIEID
jgi:hypothetical protein